MTRSDSASIFSVQPSADVYEAGPPSVYDDEDYDEEPGALNAPIRNLQPAEKTVRIDDRTPSEKTADLMRRMAPHRKVLLGILGACKEPTPVSEVSELVGRIQENHHSVYTASSLCEHLEKAGALTLVNVDGSPYEADDEEPTLVMADGVEYYETAEAPVACWLTAEAGLEALEADRPLERLVALFQSDAAYGPVYRKALLLCAGEEGASAPQLSAAIDGDPLVQKPRRCAPYFTDRLAKCDAVEWRKTWRITDVGRKGLEYLDAAADEAPTAPEA